jgi:hypothetical protein
MTAIAHHGSPLASRAPSGSPPSARSLRYVARDNDRVITNCRSLIKLNQLEWGIAGEISRWFNVAIVASFSVFSLCVLLRKQLR